MLAGASVERLPSPSSVKRAWPATPTALESIQRWRGDVANALDRAGGPLIVVVGPCSIHDSEAALEYARWVAEMRVHHAGTLMLVMRVYVEKARTRAGWPGLIADPTLDGRYDVGEGLRRARELFVRISALGVPIATEFVGLLTPAYLADLATWAAVGARTTESPVHRALASALPCPVGFKNTISGRVAGAVNGIIAARARQPVITIDDEGYAVVAMSEGNRRAHLVLRGGQVPNYASDHVEKSAEALAAAGCPARLMIDCGHGNAEGDYRRQIAAAASVAGQIGGASRHIFGVMLESHLRAGAQSMADGHSSLAYGQSITDGCLDLAMTREALEGLADAVKAGRSRR